MTAIEEESGSYEAPASGPGTFRKKPVEIEAWQLTEENVSEVSDWCSGRAFPNAKPPFLNIPTLEGVMRANVGDYVIRGIEGEFYPCRSDIFLNSYDAIIDAQQEGSDTHGIN